MAFVNPYGVELVTFPVALLSRGDILSHVIEWRSPDFRKIYGIALGARGSRCTSARSPVGATACHGATSMVTVPMLFLALWALRNIAIAPLVGLPVVARAFARDEERPDGTRRTIVVGALALIVFLGLVIGAAGVAAARLRVRDVPGEGDALRRGPRAARHAAPHRATPTPAT